MARDLSIVVVLVVSLSGCSRIETTPDVSLGGDPQTVVSTQQSVDPDIKDLGNGWVEVTVLDPWERDEARQKQGLRRQAEIEILKYKGMRIDIQELRVDQEKKVYNATQQRVESYPGNVTDFVEVFTQISSSTASGRIDSIFAVRDRKRFVNGIPHRVVRFRGHVVAERTDESFGVICLLNKDIPNYLSLIHI